MLSATVRQHISTDRDINLIMGIVFFLAGLLVTSESTLLPYMNSFLGSFYHTSTL